MLAKGSGLLEAFASAFALIFVAELGDKSMLFSMGAAMRYRWWVVLLPVAVATALLSALAVAVGSVAGEVIPEQVLGVLAGLLFLAFAAWTLRAHEDDEEDVSMARHGALRVMVALGVVFFVAEFGDKTQLATLTLASLHGGAVIGVWAGATLGMVGTNALAIAAGARLERYLPARVVRYGAATLFAAFGVASIGFAVV